MDRDAQTQGQPPGATGAPGEAHPEHPPKSVRDAVSQARNALAELREYIAFYLATQLDSIRHAVRRIGIIAGLAALALIVGGALGVVAIVMICMGVAGGLSQLMPPWVAQLVTGALILGTLVAAIFIVMARITSASRIRITEKYEARRQQQRSRFGHDVGQKAEQD